MNKAASSAPQAGARSGAEWWRGAAIYHVYPLSFADSDDDGYGDLRGVTAKLDYIRSLGVDAIWLSPFYVSPMRDFGYDIADYCDVDPRFGSLADFDALIARAHASGLRVIVDQVYSHTSDLHPWFEESRRSRDNPKADWFVWADANPDGSPPNNWQSVFKGAAWTWDARRGQYYLNNFQSEQPDLNLHNPAVQDALLAVGRFWLQRGVDGFRLDAANFLMHDPSLRDNPAAAIAAKRTRPFDFQHHYYNQSHPDIPQFLTRVRALAEEFGGAFLVGEVGGEQADAEMRLYTRGGDRLHSAYGFNFLYADKLTPGLVRTALENWDQHAGEGWPSWAFSNHDAPRSASRWATGDLQSAAKLALVLLATIRGSIFLYQGEELGLPQADIPKEYLRDPEAIANWPMTLGRDGARSPMPWVASAPNAGFSARPPWLPVDPRHAALAVDVQEASSSSTLHFTRRILALRNQFPALRTGGLQFLEAPEQLLVFTRGSGKHAILCVFNLGIETALWSLPDGWTPIEQIGEVRPGALPALASIVARRA